MKIIGLTGSIGMGKSTVSKMFRQSHIPVFDADAAVHELQGPGGALVARIEQLFPGTTNQNGVDRLKLSSAVLGQPEALKKLERLVHPAVAQMRQRFLRKNRSRRWVVLDIPLLFEKGHKWQCDVVIVVSAPLWLQRKRVLKRHNMTLSKFKHIQKLQVADHLKRACADIVIETGRLPHNTKQHVKKIIACLHRR